MASALGQEWVCLRNESISLEGVQKIVSNDEAFLLGLACGELAKNLRLVAKSVSRITKKCNDPNLQRFEPLFDEFANWGPNPHDWVLSLKEMEARMKKMDRYVTVTATLYREMDELSSMESGLSKSLKCKEKESTICDLQQNIFWQRRFIKKKKSLAEDLQLRESPCSSANYVKNVVVVMDGMEEFTTEPLEWTLENLVMPDLPRVNEKNELRSDAKYLRLQAVAELCRKYGNREFYANTIPCNMVMMNEEGGADMIRGHPMIDNGESTPGEFSPASSERTPKVIVSME
ncbi:hypothetical protein FH972_012447 [Carpinus fangiana]|uniref:DUF3475 domain-containing protein n=1 Tax=Carpinus fangiana TaxID=176857 RepID=A0A5N6R3T0_9ROSI|nr:hypothetical protein FH972_012447 [Carpinus fangiana]